MAKVVDGIHPELAAWIERQPVFFVATAPLDAAGLVNLSPKGTLGTFRVMFCAFDGRPSIVRLHGTGRVLQVGDPGFDDAVDGFGAAGELRSAYARAVITVDVMRVSDACGYAVPRMALVEERETLDAVWQSRDAERVARYAVEKNARSLDGLPGLTQPAPVT